jgi:hypothetical protein
VLAVEWIASRVVNYIKLLEIDSRVTDVITLNIKQWIEISRSLMFVDDDAKNTLNTAVLHVPEEQQTSAEDQAILPSSPSRLYHCSFSSGDFVLTLESSSQIASR